MTLLPRSQQGTLSLAPDVYGRSVLGAPLEVWRPSGRCRILIFAGIHGEEGETTAALSKALRHLGAPSPHCAVVLAANPDGLMRGTRCNARGVELNRNFPTADWRPDPVMHRYVLDAPRDVALSPGAGPASEPETRGLMALVEELAPEAVVAVHAPLACVEDPGDTRLGRWLAERTGLPLVETVGYPTPGSFGTWGAERGLPVITHEFGLTNPDAAAREQVPAFVELLTATDLPL